MIQKMQLLFLLLFSVNTFQTVRSQADKVPTKEEFKYRVVNWCIVGQGEHALYQWPFNQFKPFLLKTNSKIRAFKDNNFMVELKNGSTVNIEKSIKAPIENEIKLEFKKIRCEATQEFLGDGSGNFLNRIHVQFEISEEIEGLIIQGVHAPFQFGFPFGQFQQDEEFDCLDCEHLVSKTIGCISRPDVSLLHPTVGAFHFKHKKPDVNGTMNEVGKRKHLHFNFKWVESDCASVHSVEFWALIVMDFDHSIWMLKQFGPYDFRREQFSIGASDYKTKITQPKFPSPIFSTCQPLPPRLDAMIEKEIVTGGTYPRSCFKEYGLEYNPSQCWLWKEHKRQAYIKNNKPDPNVKTDYRIACHVGPETNRQDYFSQASSFDKSSTLSKTRFVGDFDTKCVQFYNRLNHVFDGKKTFRQPYKICPDWQGRFYCSGDTADINLGNETWNVFGKGKNPLFDGSRCVPCSTPPTTKAPAEEEKPSFIKRGVHGGLMSFAFFFFLPVSITICRFFKETLHTREIKGWRIWLLTHVGIAVLVVFLSYLSYTYPAFCTFSKNPNPQAANSESSCPLDAHMYLGYAALFCCAGGLVTGWFRHKKDSIMTISFFVHGISGYAGWGLAIGSMVLAPGIDQNARYLCYFASGFSLTAMAVLTFHVCTVDNAMEMIPPRSHIPILEIRFDDMFPPGHKFRTIFLIGYTSVQFLVCCGMMTL